MLLVGWGISYCEKETNHEAAQVALFVKSLA